MAIDDKFVEAGKTLTFRFINRGVLMLFSLSVSSGQTRRRLNLVGKFPDVKLSSFSQLLNLFFPYKLIIKPTDELREGEKTLELSFKVFKFHVFIVFD